MITKLGIQQFSLSNVSPSSKICFLGLAMKKIIFFIFFGPILTSFSDQSRHLIHNPKRSDKRCLVDSGDYNYSGCFSVFRGLYVRIGIFYFKLFFMFFFSEFLRVCNSLKFVSVLVSQEMSFLHFSISKIILTMDIHKLDQETEKIKTEGK